jgi:hypothetical protein
MLGVVPENQLGWENYFSNIGFGFYQANGTLHGIGKSSSAYHVAFNNGDSIGLKVDFTTGQLRVSWIRRLYVCSLMPIAVCCQRNLACCRV